MNVRNIETAMIQKVLSLNSEKNANAVLVDLGGVHGYQFGHGPRWGTCLWTSLRIVKR